MAPLDPGRHWLPAGITGLARQREWDAVATFEGPGAEGDEVEFVALPDGRYLVETATASVDPAPLGEALARSLEPPYRAVGVRRSDLWAVGACAIEVLELARDPGGDTVEIVSSGDGVTMRVDDLPSARGLPELERLGEARGPAYVVRAARIDGPLFEVEVEAL